MTLRDFSRPVSVFFAVQTYRRLIWNYHMCTIWVSYYVLLPVCFLKEYNKNEIICMRKDTKRWMKSHQQQELQSHVGQSNSEIIKKWDFLIFFKVVLCYTGETCHSNTFLISQSHTANTNSWSHSSLHPLKSDKSDYAPKWVRLAPNGTNLGLF